ncbi:MAG: S8 family serine peptidase [Ginsengibacter sp.]
MEKVLKIIANGLLIVLGIKFMEQALKTHKKNKNDKRDKSCPDPDLIIDQCTSKYIPSQLVVWKKPGVSDIEFEQWKQDNLQKYSGLLVKKLCKYCDDSLELWEGDNVSTLISEKVAGTGSTSKGLPPSGGGDAIAFFTYNLIIDLPEQHACIPKGDNDLTLEARPSLSNPPVLVAVFDTGLYPAIKARYTNVVNSCLRDGGLGWNFAYKNDVTDDDYPSSHGSAVTKFIIDQETIYGQQKINILPVKIHNDHGKSDLFSVLCGFAYAANCGAKIVNASFGFYASKDAEAPAILAQFVKKHLTDNNILLIAAAGNTNTDETIGQFNSEKIRNLDYHPFFPASLSKKFENVLAITTISIANGKVSPSQNFSNTIVDIGVDCDTEVDNDYRFIDPLGRGTSIIGSSYATPIVAGKIAQHYNALMSAMPGTINKSVLLNEMKNLRLIETDLRFNGYIKDGNCSKKGS